MTAEKRDQVAEKIQRLLIRNLNDYNFEHRVVTSILQIIEEETKNPKLLEETEEQAKERRNRLFVILSLHFRHVDYRTETAITDIEKVFS